MARPAEPVDRAHPGWRRGPIVGLVEPSGLSWDRLAAVWRAPRQAPWYPEAGSALEARSMDGDR